MVPGSSVLVVVDVQNGFIRPASAPVVPIIADLVRRWRSAGGAIIFTRYFNYPDSPFERLVRWDKMQGAPETDIVPELAGEAEKATAIIDKRGYTLFDDAGEALVRERGWRDLYVCGIATESCVLKTAVDAFERDLTPWVLEDASASHAGRTAHDAGILVTQRFIGKGQIIATDQLTFLGADDVAAQPAAGAR